jgi:3-hydroxy-9,10-secoandrosta-1,3,5(10)-triene-9,17-dione monooxygenase
MESASMDVAQATAASAKLWRSAEAFAPVFGERTVAATTARRLSSETVAQMRDAGMLKAYVPLAFGGDELQMVDVLPAVARLARGCSAAAWVLAVYQIHNWLVALLDNAVQQEVFADGPSPVIVASLNPMKNIARVVDGGFLIERGSFPFCSGAPAREWAWLGVQVLDANDAVVDVGALLVRGGELQEKDDWFVSGLQATGSLSLTCTDLFVPQDRLLSYASACAGSSPGLGTNPTPMFNAAFVPMLVLNLGGPGLGIAEQALQDFTATLLSKPGAYPITGEARAQAPQAHILLAEAEMQIDIARLLLNRAGRVIRDTAAHPGRMPRSLAAKTCVDTTWATRECMHAVHALFLNSGGAALTPKHSLQRAFQDVSAINCHGFLSHESAVRLYGSLVAGQTEPTAFI